MKNILPGLMFVCVLKQGVCVCTYASEHASYVFVSLHVTQACCDITIANSQDSHFCHH